MADESCDFAVVRALRSAGHDVVAIAEVSPRIRDEDVLRLARDAGRVLLTEDTDFGELVYAEGLRSSGFPADAREALVKAALDTIGKIGSGLTSRFTVVQPGRVRVGSSSA